MTQRYQPIPVHSCPGWWHFTEQEARATVAIRNTWRPWRDEAIPCPRTPGA